jgi:phosphate transport system substrate-binding protein
MNRYDTQSIHFPFFSITSLFLTVLFFAGPLHVLALDEIRINGSGTCLQMMKPLIEGFSRETRGVSVQMEKPLGSAGAIKALLAGAIDIAAVSRPLKPEEIAQGAKFRDFGKTPLAIVTEKSLPIKNISTRELEDIYSGKTVRWPNGETVRIIMRPNEDADTRIMKSLSPGMIEAITQAQQRRGLMIAVTDPESDEAVIKTRGAIGASGLAGVIAGKLPLNVLTLNGVKSSRENLANGTYPLAKDISFVTTGKLPDAAEKFLSFVYSKKGRSIAEKAGVLITVDSK